MTTPGGIPAEAELDASDELDRLKLAETFDPMELGGDNPLEPVVVPADEQAAEMRSAMGTPRVLEDLYAEHPDIGLGQKFMRVIRRQPQTYQGQRIAGFLVDLHEQIGMGDFAARFGGGTYDICVMGAMRGVLEGDEAKLRTLRTMRLDVPGRPLAMVVQMQGSTEGSGVTQRQAGFVGDQAASAQVRIAEIQAEQRMRERQDQERQRLTEQMMKQRSVSTDFMTHVDQIADKRAQEVKSSLLETLNMERERIKRLQLDLESKDAQVQQLREKLLDEQTRVATRMREDESARERELKTRYETQIADLKKSHEDEVKRFAQENAANLQRVTENSTKELSELNRRRDEERRTYESQAERERERIREDANRREQSLIQDSTLREASAQRQNEDRLRDLERSFKREIDSLTTAQARELDTIRTGERSSSVIVEKTAEIQMRSMQSEISRLEARNASLESEVAGLRTTINKTPEEAIEQAHRLAGMTGMISAADAKGDEQPPEEFSWQKGLIQLAKGAIDRAPEVLRGMEEARAHNQAVRQGIVPQGPPPAGYQRQSAQLPPGYQQLSPQQAQQMQMQQMQMQQAQQHPQVRRAYRPPAMPGAVPPAWGHGSGGTMDPSVNPHLPPVGMPNPAAVQEQPRRFANPVGSVGKPVESMPVPVSGQEVGASAGFTPFEAPPDDAAQPMAEQPAEGQPGAAQEPSPGSSAPPITQEQIVEFVDQLEGAVATGLVSPAQFAGEFVKRVGPEATIAVMSNIAPDQFVDQVVQGKGGATPLATHDGRKYVRDLWAEAAKTVGG